MTATAPPLPARDLWRLVWSYGRPYLWWYLGGSLALVLTNGLSVTIPRMLATGIDAMGTGPAGDATIRQAAVTVLVMGFAIIGIRTASRILFFTPGRLIEATLVRDLFGALMRQQPDFFAKMPPGELASRITADVQYARLLYGFATLGFVNTIAALAMGSGQLVAISPTLGILAAIPLLIAFIVAWRSVDQLVGLHREGMEINAELSSVALTSFQGIAAVHAFGAAPALVANFDQSNDLLRRNQLRRALLRGSIGVLLGLATTVDVALVLWFGRADGGIGLTVGETIAFAAIVGYLAGPLRTLTFTLTVSRQAVPTFERIAQILGAVPLRPEGDTGAPPPDAPPRLQVAGLTVSYSGPTGETRALDEVAFDVAAGGCLGVFGQTGSGKTTLVRALLRLVDPPAGAIRVDGVDVRALDLDGWRRAAVLVPQRPFLFSESVADNVSLGQDIDLDAVIKAAQLDIDVASWPDGLDAMVGEAGITLSGGQRQRTALARGLARPAKLLVLDDVLSAVDPATEAALLRMLREREGHPTTVIVSNRIRALEHADQIVVLERGRVQALGTHEALVKLAGPYREAWLRQEER